MEVGWLGEAKILFHFFYSMIKPRGVWKFGDNCRSSHAFHRSSSEITIFNPQLSLNLKNQYDDDKKLLFFEKLKKAAKAKNKK